MKAKKSQETKEEPVDLEIRAVVEMREPAANKPQKEEPKNEPIQAADVLVLENGNVVILN